MIIKHIHINVIITMMKLTAQEVQLLNTTGVCKKFSPGFILYRKVPPELWRGAPLLKCHH